MGRERVTHDIDLTGAAGSASGSVDHYVGQPSRLIGVVLQYTGQPATVDVTITNEGRAVAARSNANTTAIVYPRVLTQDETGANTTNREAPLVLGTVTVAVAQGNAQVGGVRAILVFE